MDFVNGLPVFTNWKVETYDSILVIVNRLTKMVHYEPVKVTIDTPSLAKVIIDVVVRHHSCPTQSLAIEAQFSPPSSGFRYAIF